MDAAEGEHPHEIPMETTSTAAIPETSDTEKSTPRANQSLARRRLEPGRRDFKHLLQRHNAQSISKDGSASSTAKCNQLTASGPGILKVDLPFSVHYMRIDFIFQDFRLTCTGNCESKMPSLWKKALPHLKPMAHSGSTPAEDQPDELLDVQE